MSKTEKFQVFTFRFLGFINSCFRAYFIPAMVIYFFALNFSESIRTAGITAGVYAAISVLLEYVNYQLDREQKLAAFKALQKALSDGQS